MQAYSIKYTVRGKNSDGRTIDTLIDARDLKSAKKKLARKHGYKDGRMIKIEEVRIIGYY